MEVACALDPAEEWLAEAMKIDSPVAFPMSVTLLMRTVETALSASRPRHRVFDAISPQAQGRRMERLLGRKPGVDLEMGLRSSGARYRELLAVE